MNINYLEEFIALAGNMNFSDVADQFYISQSTLSRHIKHLETELDVELFDRSKHKAELTRAGEAILPYAVDIVRAYTKLTDLVSYHRRGETERIVVGFTSFALKHDLFQMIFDFSKRHPDVSWQFIENNCTKLTGLLESNLCDFAFIRHHYVAEESIAGRLNWYQDRFILALPTSHPLAKFDTIKLEQLREEKFIIVRDHLLVIDMLYQLCETLGFRPKIQTKNKAMDTILNTVAYGDGITVLTKSELEQMPPYSNVSFVEFDPPLKLITSLYHQPENTQTAVAKQFIQYLRESLQSETGEP